MPKKRKKTGKESKKLVLRRRNWKRRRPDSDMSNNSKLQSKNKTQLN